MRTCKCSVRTLDLFVKDLAGISLKQRQPHLHLQSRRRFSTKPLLRLLESRVTSQVDNGFVPFDIATTRTKSSISVTQTQEDTGVDDEWHAEMEVMAPWPQETRSALPTPAVDGDCMKYEVSDLSDTIARQVELQQPSECPVIEDQSTQPEDQPSLNAFADDVASSASQATVSTTQRSRAESRLERKRRRQKAGTYTPDAQKRYLEKTGQESYKDALESIEAMPGPSATAGQRTRRSLRVAGENHQGDARTGQVGRKDGSSVFTHESAENETVTSQPRPQSNHWGTQKDALTEKFGTQGWQPRKRLSPDTLEGIRGLHKSDSEAYSTETLAEHFKITPEAIRRILKSKWQPSEDELEDRRQRWEKRGVKTWTKMAQQGMRPPARWKAKGVVSLQMERRRKQQGRTKPQYVPWG